MQILENIVSIIENLEKILGEMNHFMVYEIIRSIVISIITYIILNVIIYNIRKPIKEYKEFQGKIVSVLLANRDLYSNPMNREKLSETEIIERKSARRDIIKVGAEFAGFISLRSEYRLNVCIPRNEKLIIAKEDIIGLSNNLITEYDTHKCSEQNMAWEKEICEILSVKL